MLVPVQVQLAGEGSWMVQGRQAHDCGNVFFRQPYFAWLPANTDRSLTVESSCGPKTTYRCGYIVCKPNDRGVFCSQTKQHVSFSFFPQPLFVRVLTTSSTDRSKCRVPPWPVNNLKVLLYSFELTTWHQLPTCSTVHTHYTQRSRMRRRGKNCKHQLTAVIYICILHTWIYPNKFIIKIRAWC